MIGNPVQKNYKTMTQQFCFQNKQPPFCSLFKTKKNGHKGNLALFLAYFLAIFWHMPGFISGMCQKFYCTILCSQISPKFLAYYRAIIPLWLGTRLGTYFSRDVASHSTSRKNTFMQPKIDARIEFLLQPGFPARILLLCSQDSPPEI